MNPENSKDYDSSQEELRDLLHGARVRFSPKARAADALPTASAPAVEPHTMEGGRYETVRAYEARRATTRTRNGANQRARRARLKAAQDADVKALMADLGPIAEVRLPREAFAAERTVFAAWLAADGPMQRQYRKRARECLAVRKVILEARLNGLTLTPLELARRLSPLLGVTIGRERGKQLLKVMVKLEGAGGPWPAVTAGGEPSPRAKHKAK